MAIDPAGFNGSLYMTPILTVEDIFVQDRVNGLAQNCSNSSALALELLQSCAKPSEWHSIIEGPQ